MTDEESSLAYTWPLPVESVFKERAPQMVSLGLPPADVDLVRSRVIDMWANQPGGWVYEWSALARSYADAGKASLSALAYGYAKFPTLADAAKRTAYSHQIEQYLAAAATSGKVSLDRRVVEVEHRGERVPVTVHQIAGPQVVTAQSPVVLASGGVDGWKEDMHNIWTALTLFTGATVLAFDIPGTGESTVAMTAAGGPQIVTGLVAEARRIGNGKVAHVGISMGGWFSARTGLTGEVDGSMVLGGPVRAAFDEPPHSEAGMGGIIGNALGLDAPIPESEMSALWSEFSLRRLLDNPQTVPMLIVNGADDPLIPQADTMLFEGRAHTQVVLVPDSGHCAASKLSEVLPIIVQWLTGVFAPAAA